MTDDEGPDPDYGPDLSNPVPIWVPSEREIAERRRWRQRREAEERVSRDFNSHLIHLFNTRKP